MFWIYIPPIILVIALTLLIIMIGRKSSDLKQIKDIEPRNVGISEKKGWSERLNAFGGKVLHLTEIMLNLIKSAFNKIEYAIAVWVKKLRERRNGKQLETPPENEYREPDEADILHEIEEREELSMNAQDRSANFRYMGQEVIVRKKRIEEPPVIITKKEPLPENKVQEAALIYRIAENPKDIEAYREIGDYYMGIGNIKDAKESFKMVLKLRPRDLKAKSSLREIEMKMRLGS